MNELDISSQDPEEFSGKSVLLNSAEYRVGPHLGTGAHKIVFSLINQKSNICQHVIKIYRDQKNGESLVESMEDAYAKLRCNAELIQMIPVTLFFRLHGGYFEVQNYVGSEDENEKFSLQKNEAGKAMEQGKIEVAEYIYNDILLRSPYDTFVIFNLAACAHKKQKYADAYQLACTAVDIEPNYILYRRGQIAYAFDAGFLNFSCVHFEETKNLFPRLVDLFELGVDLYLECGRPEDAKLLADKLPLTDEDRLEKSKAIDDAVAAKRKALYLLEQAKANITETRKARSAIGDIIKDSFRFVRGRNEEVDLEERGFNQLKEAVNIYDKYPVITLNFGLALGRAGCIGEAIGIVIREAGKMSNFYSCICYANAGYLLARAEQWEAALHAFDAAMATLILVSGDGEIAFADLPGVARWIDHDTVIEELPSESYRLLSLAISQCKNDSAITENILEMSNLLSKACSAMD